MKYVIVTGGVTSSLGKGVVTATIGQLLKNQGYSVLLQKCDPYLNVNPGTLSPAQHGEIFITEDGAETDLDLGHYERFVDINLTKDSDITTGQIYQSILEKECHGDYLGSTVQVIPHVTDEIKKRLYHKDDEADIVVTEIGGTVGDIESLPFLEAVRQIKNEIGSDNVVYVHVTLVPTVISEVKTKPTQHSVKELRSIGIQPDILICRTEKCGFLTKDMKKKISLFCNVERAAVFENHNVDTIYELPKLLYDQGLDIMLLRKLNLPYRNSNPKVWNDIDIRIKNLHSSSKQIGIIGEFTELPDAYISVTEALKHAFLAVGESMKISMISSREIEECDSADKVLDRFNGIVIAGDFNEKDMEGKVKAVLWAKKRQLPCLGIDNGFFAIAVEAAMEERIHGDNSSVKEVYNAITETDDIRLGSMECFIYPDSKKVKSIYGADIITERYRVKDYLRNSCLNFLELNDLYPVGETEHYKTIVEHMKHPWLIGCLFHPEFKSRPDKPHPLIENFVRAVIS